MGLAAGAGVLASVSLVGGLAWRGELVSADLRQRLLPARLRSASRVFVIAIDDDSVRAAVAEPRIRNWPWPRWTYARMLDVLALAKPAAIGIDILFPEPRDGDDELAGKLKETPAVLACDSGANGGPGGISVPGPPPAEAPDRGVVSRPVSALAAVAPYAAIHVEADADGITRAFPLVSRCDGTALASLPLALAVRAGASVESRHDGVWVNGRRVTGADGTLWLRFASLGTVRYIPAWQVLEAWQSMFDGDDPARVTAFLAGLEGGVVIVSATATGAFDLRPTPVAALSPGSEVQATAVADLLDGRRLRPPSVWLQTAAAAGMALLVGVLSLLVRRPALLTLSGLALVAGWCVVAGAAWAKADAWVPVCLPVLGGVLAIPTLLVEGWWREGMERRRVQGIFGRYVAPDILRVLLEHPEAARLGGERRRITVLFSDIRSYTTLSEKMPPEEVVGWLNEYFSEQVAVIHAHRGTVDKFIGDAVMAFWGAPLPEAEQERLAARCAEEMIRTSRRLGEEWRERGGPPLAIGVGIATGDAVVGNVGAEQLRAYTAIGDTVNLASRLEGKTKDLAVPVVLDEATASACGLLVRAVGEVTVKGRAAAVKVFALPALDV
ncbi:MAG: hypothetical protein A2Y78_15985 [Acidobacteria bacterium RBG_13_68_16]|nr:MAG: hypothetical protein A2Y78_15985 [Acidobacteria bacterium RBG_13_68_16]